MKGIKKNLVAGALACGAAFNAHNAHAEVSRFSYGPKVGLSFSPYAMYPEGVKIDSKAVSHSFFDTPFVHVSFDARCNLSDYIGVGLGVGYIKKGATLTAEQEKDQQTEEDSKTTPSVNATTHNIDVPLYLCIFPTGNPDGEDFFTIKLGGSVHIPILATYRSNDKEVKLNDNQKKEEASFNMGVNIDLEYQFADLGVYLGVGYRMGLMNAFNLDKDKDKEQTIFSNTSGLKDLKIHTATVSLGYNIATFFAN
ncbi:outer membrane beta-barrel protein [Cardinium endosymbiont of Sogatella furcifera]|uniref:outer membrane beta-barrel protein n=1 Tax=Cardinium endosymbiont of Sogatella furcifera TaxID=650378 RepID=UPI000E0DEA26|nr:outer membrane beta-barrel protein [Cardinium endosymbiont of Sogatella furcifera]